MKDLPDGVQWLITRKAGRDIREVSKALQSTFGPLDCGLSINCTNLTDITSLLDSNPTRFTAVITLHLGTDFHSQDTELLPILRTVPTTFPALQHLTIHNSVPATPADLAPLTALAPTLTSLTLPDSLDLLSTLPQLTSLTNLSTLSVCPKDAAHYPHPAAAAQATSHLSTLPSLSHLDLRRNFYSPLPASIWLPALAPLSTLTHLALNSSPSHWATPAVSTLATAFPSLRSLSMQLTLPTSFSSSPPLHPLDPLFHALASRTALTALHLDICLPAILPSLTCLSSLSLSSLHVNLSTTQPSAKDTLLAAISTQSHLTHLSFSTTYHSCHLTPPNLAHLTALAPTLRSLSLHAATDSPADLLSAVAHLTALTHLNFEHTYFNGQPILPAHVAPLSALTSLRSLHIIADHTGLAPTLIHHVPASSFPHLHTLEINALFPNDDAPAPTSTSEPAAIHTDDAPLVPSLSEGTADACMHALLPYSTQLTHLVVHMEGLTGAGLRMLRHMCALRVLHVGSKHRFYSTADCLLEEGMHRHLLPLPPRLRQLWLHSGFKAKGPPEHCVRALREAGLGQHCNVVCASP